MKTTKRHDAINYYLFLLATLTTVFSTNPYASEQAPLTTAGWIERATLYPENVLLKAKLDTGAKTSSINAAQLRITTRKNQKWVQFSLVTYEGKTIDIEQPIVRYSTIKRHYGRKQVRPVVRLDFCVGNVRKNAEVSLVDRSGLNYQFLVGRNFLANNILVDSGKTFLLRTHICPDSVK
jgi:hypothetical protein